MSSRPNHRDAVVLPDPYRANLLWRPLQILAQVLSPVWFRLRTRGIHRVPKRGGVLLVINHQSFLDPVVMCVGLRRPVSFIARESLFGVPVLGWIMRHMYAIPLSREATSPATLREAVRRLKHGFLVGIFPEGTRGDGRGIQELKPGFIALVRRSRLPVLPVGVAGTGKAYSRDFVFPRPRRVYIYYGEPISVDELEPLCRPGRDESLIALIRERMIACFRQAEAWRCHAERLEPSTEDRLPASTAGGRLSRVAR